MIRIAVPIAHYRQAAKLHDRIFKSVWETWRPYCIFDESSGHKSSSKFERLHHMLTCMEQNFGPHMEQKWAVLAGSWGSVASWNSLAVTGSSDRLNWSYLHKHTYAIRVTHSRMQAASSAE